MRHVISEERERKGYIPAIRDGDDAGAVLGDLQEHWHSKVEVWPWRIAPPAIVTWKSVVRRTKIGGRHED